MTSKTPVSNLEIIPPTFNESNFFSNRNESSPPHLLFKSGSFDLNSYATAQNGTDPKESS